MLGITRAARRQRMPFSPSLMPRLTASQKRRGVGLECTGDTGDSSSTSFRSALFILSGPNSSRSLRSHIIDEGQGVGRSDECTLTFVGADRERSCQAPRAHYEIGSRGAGHYLSRSAPTKVRPRGPATPGRSSTTGAPMRSEWARACLSTTYHGPLQRKLGIAGPTGYHLQSSTKPMVPKHYSTAFRIREDKLAKTACAGLPATGNRSAS